MNDMHDLYKLKDMLLEELKSYGQGKELTTGSLEMVDKLAHTVKNLCKICESAEEEEYSRADGSMADGSYRGSYRMRGSYADEGGSYRRRRDSMGRYSREGGYSRAEEKEDELRDIVNQLRSMAKDLPQPTQRAIQNFTEMVG
jgi:hypothetical protein